MNKCIFHGEYSGSACEQCAKIESEKKVEKDSSFTLFLIKNAIMMTVGIFIGWVIFSFA